MSAFMAIIEGAHADAWRIGRHQLPTSRPRARRQALVRQDASGVDEYDRILGMMGNTNSHNHSDRRPLSERAAPPRTWC